MARNYTKTLLVSANVGSIFEDPEKMLKMWLQEFLATVKRLDPDFLAIHCQEVGGKNYEESMVHVNVFVKELLTSPEMQQFDKARVFLDEDFTAVDKFTALGNLYFIHQSVQNVQIYDFKDSKFVPVKGREVLSGNIEEITIKEKSKFPQEFFPDFKWSRKGFIRTRWNIQNTVVDLINIHLFHDASNIVAMESSPSVYSGNRYRTLRHTLERFENDQYPKVPFYIFGDFNFRLDTHNLIKKLCENTTLQKTMGKKNDVSKVIYEDPESKKAVLTVEKKAFYHSRHSEVFSNNNGLWLHEYDPEPANFHDKLDEYDVTFPPSYPFSEDVSDGTSYMKTRCPSWCDRIMFSHDVPGLLYKDDSGNAQTDYSMMGVGVCMGDHKPIYVNTKLRHGAGNLDPGTAATTPLPPPLSSSSSPTDPCMSSVSLSPAPADADAVPPQTPLNVVIDKQPLQKVISINGEEVEVSSPDGAINPNINIHDFASFEKEEVIGQFMNSIKRKSVSSLKKRPSFKNMVRDVIRAESFLKALRHYSHRSDSEYSEDDSDAAATESGSGGAGSKRPSRKRRSAKGRGGGKSSAAGDRLEIPGNSGGEQTTSSSGDASPEPPNAAAAKFALVVEADAATTATTESAAAPKTAKKDDGKVKMAAGDSEVAEKSGDLPENGATGKKTDVDVGQVKLNVGEASKTANDPDSVSELQPATPSSPRILVSEFDGNLEEALTKERQKNKELDNSKTNASPVVENNKDASVSEKVNNTNNTNNNASLKVSAKDLLVPSEKVENASQTAIADGDVKPKKKAASNKACCLLM